MKYPLDSEYAYLQSVIQSDYFADDDREVAPLFKAEDVAWHGDSDLVYELVHQVRVEAQHRILQRRQRREDILTWLFLDTQLRQEGSSYADEYEKFLPLSEQP